jgi:hypothetical protein
MPAGIPGLGGIIIGAAGGIIGAPGMGSGVGTKIVTGWIA